MTRAALIEPLRRGARWQPAEIAFWLLPVAAWFLFPGDLLLLSQIAVVALFALSLDLILGYAGIVSLGHAAFFGAGAYAAGLLSKHVWNEPVSGLVVAAGVAALLGWLTSFLVLRGSDLTRLMVTLAVCLMLAEAANKATGLTGGADGLQDMNMGEVLGLFRFDLRARTAYVYSMVVLFVLFVLARRLVHSPFGLSLRGVRENVRRMPAIGAPVDARLQAVYTLGAAYAGVAGALLTQTTQFVALDSVSFERSAELMLILVLGGSGHLYGALLGAILFTLAHHVLSDINPTYWQFWLGLLLLVVVLFAKGGLMGGLIALRDRLRAARSPGAAETAARQ